MAIDDLDRIDRAFAEGTAIDSALAKAVREALRQHKKAGNPVAEWRDGKVCWIAAADIQIDEEE
jgi:hypothetical protein